MKLLSLFTLILLFANFIKLPQETMDDNLPGKTIIGKAVNAKVGACIIDDSGTVYVIDGLDSWKERFLNKRLLVKGRLTVQEQKEALQNEKGEYKTGQIGKVNILSNALLPVTHESIALVVVFKKETLEKAAKTIMEKAGYPFHEGMDSSRGKGYFYKTGEKYIILFPLEEEKNTFLKNNKDKSEIYEIYEPDWDKCKD
jgi:hypothetical protein